MLEQFTVVVAGKNDSEAAKYLAPYGACAGELVRVSRLHDLFLVVFSTIQLFLLYTRQSDRIHVYLCGTLIHTQLLNGFNIMVNTLL